MFAVYGARCRHQMGRAAGGWDSRLDIAAHIPLVRGKPLPARCAYVIREARRERPNASAL